jgi:hypothetical protein
MREYGGLVAGALVFLGFAISSIFTFEEDATQE